MKSMIEEGALGEIYYARSVWFRRRGIPGLAANNFNTGSGSPMGSWFYDKAQSGGGPLIDLGVHRLDLALWLMGYPKPVWVMASTYDKFGPRLAKQQGLSYTVEDLACAMIKFENGCTLELDASWASNIRENELQTIRLLGDKGGMYQYNLNEGYTYEVEYYSEIAGRAFDAKCILRTRCPALQLFADSVRDNTPFLVQPEEGVTVMKILDAIYQSAGSGEPGPDLTNAANLPFPGRRVRSDTEHLCFTGCSVFFCPNRAHGRISISRLLSETGKGEGVLRISLPEHRTGEGFPVGQRCDAVVFAEHPVKVCSGAEAAVQGDGGDRTDRVFQKVCGVFQTVSHPEFGKTFSGAFPDEVCGPAGTQMDFFREVVQRHGFGNLPADEKADPVFAGEIGGGKIVADHFFIPEKQSCSELAEGLECPEQLLLRGPAHRRKIRRMNSFLRCDLKQFGRNSLFGRPADSGGQKTEQLAVPHHRKHPLQNSRMAELDASFRDFPCIPAESEAVEVGTHRSGRSA